MSRTTNKKCTIKRKLKLIKDLMRENVNISNPDSVQAFLNSVSWKNGTKNLGFHASLSFLMYLANSNASSLIRVSMVCLFPTFILGISTMRSNNVFRASASSLVSNSQWYTVFLDESLSLTQHSTH